MHSFFLALHSWNRWVLLVTAILLVVKSLAAFIQQKPYASSDRQLALVLFWSLNIQLLIGLVLLGVSPFMQAAYGDMSATMSNAATRFYLAEHPVMAILAIGAGHFGIARAKKSADDRAKHRFILIGVGLCVVLLLAVIPWPQLPYGRPLFWGL